MIDRLEAVERALGYPYPSPERSFAQLGERTVALAEVEVELAGRTPLVAYGSNAAPGTLARKLRGDADPLPLVRAELAGFDVVYSAHVSAYGAVPATLRRSPATVVSVFVAFPTSGQLRALSATEPNYELERLPGTGPRLETGEEVAEPSAYLSRHGCLLADGFEIALEAVPARGRVFPAMGQRQVLERVRDELRPDLDLERFVLDPPDGAIRPAGRLDRAEAP